jgi:YtcA family
MLSTAKHLLFLTGNKQKQILRSAQDDVGSFLSALLRKAWFVFVPLLLASCSRAPSFDILGSFFPAWLVCLAVSILLTFLARWLLLRLHIAVVVPILVYPSLTFLFAFALWLIFFR